MAKKVKEKNKELNDIEFEYEKEIKFTCPVRGEVVQKVKVKRIRPQRVPEPIIYNLSLVEDD